MKLNKYNLNRKLLAQLLLLSLGLNIIFDFKILMASVPTVGALTQRAVMLKKISDPLNNTILNSANPFMQAPGPVPAWNLVWSSLKTKVETGNLQPSDLVNPVNSDLAVLTTANKFTSIYNNIYSQLAVDMRGTVLGDDANQSLLLSLLYFGADAPHDGSVFTEDDGVTLGNWYPAAQDPDGNPRPIASFYAPDSVWFNTNSANNNFETPGGLLIKTQVTNNNFCAALDKVYGAGVWSGATCISNSDCCKDSTGVQQTCIKNSTIEKLVPQLIDPVTGETIVYGICDTLDTAVCGTALGAACNGSGSGPDNTPGCCMSDKLVCVNQDQAGDNINNFKCLADMGGFCNSNSDCALADSKCVDNSCVAPKSTVPPTPAPGSDSSDPMAYVTYGAVVLSAIGLGIAFVIARSGKRTILVSSRSGEYQYHGDDDDLSVATDMTDSTDGSSIDSARERVLGAQASAVLSTATARLAAAAGDAQVAIGAHGAVGAAEPIAPGVAAAIDMLTADSRGTFIARPAIKPEISVAVQKLIQTKLTDLVKAAWNIPVDGTLDSLITANDNAGFKGDLALLLLLEEAKVAANTATDKPVDYNNLMRLVIGELNDRLDAYVVGGNRLVVNPKVNWYSRADFLRVLGSALNIKPGALVPEANFLETKVGASTYQMCQDIAQARTQQSGSKVTPEQVYSALRDRMLANQDAQLADRFPDWRTAPATRAPDFPYDRFAK